MARRFRVIVAGGWYHVVNRGHRRDVVRWLPVSYSSASNWDHRVRGHLFEGCFRSLLIDDRLSNVVS